MDFYHYKKLKKRSWWWFDKKGELLTTFLLKHKKGRHNYNLLELSADVNSTLDKNFPDRYVMDINQSSLDRVKKAKKKIKWDVQKKFPLKVKFDAIIISDVLEHVNKPSAVMKNCFDVLKDGGIVLITVPAIKSIYGPHDVALDHKKRYTKKDALNLVGKYKIKKFTYWNFFLSFPIIISRLLQRGVERKGTDIVNVPGIVDKILRGILSFENFLIRKGFYLPIGITIFMVVEK